MLERVTLLAGERDSAAAEVLVDQAQVWIGVGIKHSDAMSRCAAGQLLSNESGDRADFVVSVGGMNDHCA
ncbi:hypothetical protein [Rhodococcus sp. RS1C4]|nr:hypothetical protein [Rhodococcus sp. RS1C4]